MKSVSSATSSVRRGHTLVELVISMTSATLLLAGLTSCLFITIRAFEGTTDTAVTARGFRVQADMMEDLSAATSFSSRTADAVTFTVPDRNGDLVPETLSYAWTGLPSAELTYAVNGGAATTVLSNVQDFTFNYLDRFMSAASGPPPPLDPSQWGMRWKTSGNFGWETIYPLTDSHHHYQIGTLVMLNTSGTLQSISGHFTLEPGRSTEVGFAIYDTSNYYPRNLLAETSLLKINSSGWTTLSTPAISLNSGIYCLALFHNHREASYHTNGGAELGRTFLLDHNAKKKGWLSTWTGGTYVDSRVSIYATLASD